MAKIRIEKDGKVYLDISLAAIVFFHFQDHLDKLPKEPFDILTTLDDGVTTERTTITHIRWSPNANH